MRHAFPRLPIRNNNLETLGAELRESNPWPPHGQAVMIAVAFMAGMNWVFRQWATWGFAASISSSMTRERKSATAC